MHQQDKEKENEQNVPRYPAFEEFLRLHPPGREHEKDLNYYSTNEILGMCNDIAFDDRLSESMLLELLKGHQYDLINFGGTTPKWRIK